MKTNLVRVALASAALAFTSAAGFAAGTATEAVVVTGSTAKTGGTTAQQSGETKSDNTGGAASGGGHHDLSAGGIDRTGGGILLPGTPTGGSNSPFAGSNDNSTHGHTDKNTNIIFGIGGHGDKAKADHGDGSGGRHSGNEEVGVGGVGAGTKPKSTTSEGIHAGRGHNSAFDSLKVIRGQHTDKASSAPPSSAPHN